MRDEIGNYCITATIIKMCRCNFCRCDLKHTFKVYVFTITNENLNFL